MKLWHLLILYVTIFVLFVASLMYAISMTIKAVDESGGLKSVIERVWSGEPK